MSSRTDRIGPVAPDGEGVAGEEARPPRARGRAAKQERSERTRSAIVAAVISVLADEGVAGLTHRLVARRSGASLAATTYYFTGKSEMIAEASGELIRAYMGEFEQLADTVSGSGPAAFRRFVADLAAQAMSEYRTSTLAWCEIMLDGARRAETRALARRWFERTNMIWRHAAEVFHIPDPESVARSASDVMLGALFHGVALGFTPAQMADSFDGGIDPDQLFPSAPVQRLEPAACRRPSAKASATRERILDAAIRLLASRGAGAVNYRAVALEAGLTPGAPAYHFASAEDLLAEAQVVLFSRSKARYREVMADTFDGLDLPTMIELTAVIFQSEATEHGALNLAGFAIWLQAARDPELRALVREAIGDFYHAWRRTLTALDTAASGAEPLLVQYLFVGALIRAVSCGVTRKDLVETRTQLKRELSAMAEGRHWLQAAG